MHVIFVIFEGVLNLNCKLLLHYLIYEKSFFTLKYLNEAISIFSYCGRDAVNAPRVIDREKVSPESSKITQSGINSILIMFGDMLYSE